RVLEYPRGKALFQTEGFISDPRFSWSGDRIAFVHHPVSGDTMGELEVVDLEGRAKVLSPRYATVQGVAWAPRDTEIWCTSGELQRNLVRAAALDARIRAWSRAPS